MSKITIENDSITIKHGALKHTATASEWLRMVKITEAALSGEKDMNWVLAWGFVEKLKAGVNPTNSRIHLKYMRELIRAYLGIEAQASLQAFSSITYILKDTPTPVLVAFSDVLENAWEYHQQTKLVPERTNLRWIEEFIQNHIRTTGARKASDLARMETGWHLY